MWKVEVLVTQSYVPLFASPGTVAWETPLSMGFSRQECWSGLSFLSPGDLLNPGIEPGSPALQADFFPIWNTNEVLPMLDFDSPAVLVEKESPTLGPQQESWALTNGCFWTVVLGETLESHLDGKEIQPVHPKGNQSWIFIGRTDAEAETPILWPPDAKSRFIWKDPDAGKDWRPEETGTTEDEVVGCRHQLKGHESD